MPQSLEEETPVGFEEQLPERLPMPEDNLSKNPHVDGGLHEISSPQRETILSRICAPECPWTMVIVTTDPNIKLFVQERFSLR
ncbi:MAG: hypothetical protein ABI618_13500 [Nitrospirota bacterium]